MFCIHTAKFLGRPVNPIAKDKNVEPANMNAIIHEVLVAPNKDDLNVSNVKLFWKYDRIKDPTTPKEAASVAVAIPVYIDPMTEEISKITGKSCFDLLIFSKNEYSSIIFGISFLLINDQIITYDIKIKAIIIPGIIPAMNNFAMDSWTATP